jgi:hypothetical protein
MKPACIHTNLRSLSLFGTLEIHIRLLHVCTCTRSPPHTYALARTPTHARPRTHARTYARLRARITHTCTHTYSHHILTLTQAAAETTRKNAEAISAADATVAAAATREEKERVAAVAKRGKKERAAAAVSVFLFWLKQIV